MEAIQDLTVLRNELPHGAIKVIADKLEIGYYIVLRIMNGATKSQHTPNVVKAAAEYLIEYNQKKLEAQEAINKALGKTIAD